jgi:hypothetical protein
VGHGPAKDHTQLVLPHRRKIDQPQTLALFDDAKGGTD